MSTSKVKDLDTNDDWRLTKPVKGYTLYRNWDEDEDDTPKDEDDDDDSSEEEDDGSVNFIPFAWTMIPLFCPEEELISGLF